MATYITCKQQAIKDTQSEVFRVLSNIAMLKDCDDRFERNAIAEAIENQLKSINLRLDSMSFVNKQAA